MTDLIDGVRIHGHRSQDHWAADVLDPRTGHARARLTGGLRRDAQAAVDRAETAAPAWQALDSDERAARLLAICADLRRPETSEEIALLASSETGKLLAEARAEVQMTAGFFEFFAQQARGATSTGPTGSGPFQHDVALRPLGVVVASCPWNFPVSIPGRKLAAILAAGCTAVLKPSEVAPSATLALAELMESHLPDGVLSTLVGDARMLTETWLADPRVRGFSFTGSTRVGRSIAAQATLHFTRCVLELGGNAPFVVLPDHDTDEAVQLLMQAKYRNNGQSCIAANVAWVPARHLDRFVDRFHAASLSLVAGDPSDPRTQLGPLALPTDADRLEMLAADARDHGADVLRGCSVPAQGHFVSPIIAVEPSLDARVVREETFGPGLAIVGYETPDEPLDWAARQPTGLAGYVTGTDDAETRAFAQRLDVGIVGINTATPNSPHVPFGGLRESGVGWEGGRAGLEAFLTPRVVASPSSPATTGAAHA